MHPRGRQAIRAGRFGRRRAAWAAGMAGAAAGAPAAASPGGSVATAGAAGSLVGGPAGMVGGLGSEPAGSDRTRPPGASNSTASAMIRACRRSLRGRQASPWAVASSSSSTKLWRGCPRFGWSSGQTVNRSPVSGSRNATRRAASPGASRSRAGDARRSGTSGRGARASALRRTRQIRPSRRASAESGRRSAKRIAVPPLASTRSPPPM